MQNKISGIRIKQDTRESEQRTKAHFESRYATGYEYQKDTHISSPPCQKRISALFKIFTVVESADSPFWHDGDDIYYNFSILKNHSHHNVSKLKTFSGSA